MILIASLAIASAAAAQPAPQPAPTQARAQATIRIISAAQLRFGEIEKSSPELLRSSLIRSADGIPQRAKLVEFQ